MNCFEEIPSTTCCNICNDGLAHLRKDTNTLRDVRGTGEVLGEVEMFYYQCCNCDSEFADKNCIQFNDGIVREFYGRKRESNHSRR